MTRQRAMDEAARRFASLDLAGVLPPESEAATVADLAQVIEGVGRLAKLGLDGTDPALSFSPMRVTPHVE